MNRLEGKVALITGGTSGIGLAFSKLFALEGAEVVIVGRSANKGKIAIEEIQSKGGKAKFICCDITDGESVDNLYQEYCNQYDKLDILVNNAGILLTAPLEEIEEEEWLRVFDTNVHSAMRVTKKFIELVKKAQGNILNVASNTGLQSLTIGRANYAYCASKSALIKFTQQLALNYTPLGIRVNCLCPGTTETPIFTNRDFSRFNDTIPMGRVGQPEEIAKAALFLVSSDASYVSGAILTVDGAASLK